MGRRKKKRSKSRARPAVEPAGRRGIAPALRAHLAEHAGVWGAAATALAFAIHLFATSDPFTGSGTDIASMEAPVHGFAAHWIRRGCLPLWNPFVLGGVPFQAGVRGFLYPPWWIDAILPLALAVKVGIAAHLCLAAAGGAWMARTRSRLAAYLAGTTWALSAFFAVHLFAGHLELVATAAYLPWLAGAIDRARERTGIRSLILGAAIAGAMLLAGHYQIVYIGAGGLLAHAILEGLLGEREGGAGPTRRLVDAGQRSLFPIGFLVAGGLVAAVQILPAFEVVGLSQRSGGGVEFAASFSSAPANLLTYAMPHLFGNRVDAPFVGDWSYWESLGYMGLAPLGLASFALVALPWRRWLPAAAVMTGAIVLSLGAHTPVFSAYAEVFPGADLFRSPGRFCLLVTLFGSLLASRAMDAWLSGEVPPRRARLALVPIALLAAAAAAAGAVLGPPEDPGDPGWIAALADPERLSRLSADARAALLDASPQAIRAALGLAFLAAILALGTLRPRRIAALGVLLAAAHAIDLYGFGHRFLSTGPASLFDWPKAVTEIVVAEGGPGVRMIPPADRRWHGAGAPHGIGNPGGYDIFLDGRYARYLNRSQGRDPDLFFAIERLRRGGPLVRHLGVRFLLSARPLEDGAAGRVRGYSWLEPYRKIGDLHLYRDPDPVPRAALVHEIEVVHDEMEIYRRMESPRFDIRRVALLDEDPPDGFPKPEAAVRKAEESAEIETYEPNRVEISVRATSRAVLVLSDVLHPAWRASVDGEPAPIAHANRVMRAVPVPAGEHLVEMTYLPGSVVAGAIVSILAIAALLAAALLARRSGGPWRRR